MKKINLNFNDFLDVGQHINEIKSNAQKIKNHHTNRSAKEYLDALFGYFLEDIKKTAKYIYENILQKQNIKKFKFTASNLKGCIENGIQHFLSTYEDTINEYNSGGIFGFEYYNFKHDKCQFKEQAEKTIKEQIELFYSKYCNYLKKNRRENVMFIAVIVAAITGLITVIPNKAVITITGFSHHIISKFFNSSSGKDSK